MFQVLASAAMEEEHRSSSTMALRRAASDQYTEQTSGPSSPGRAKTPQSGVPSGAGSSPLFRSPPPSRPRSPIVELVLDMATNVKAARFRAFAGWGRVAKVLNYPPPWVCIAALVHNQVLFSLMHGEAARH